MPNYLVIKMDHQTYELKLMVSVINDKVGEELKNELYKLLDQEAKVVTINFIQVNRMETSGINKILLFYKKLNDIHGRLNLKGLNTEIYRLFHLMRFDQLFNISQC